MGCRYTSQAPDPWQDAMPPPKPPHRRDHRLVPRSLKALALGAIALAPHSARADCIDEAAYYHQVHPYVLRAIAYQESQMRADVTHVNTNRTTDYGVMGINSVHLSELSGFGIAREQLLDPCVSAYVGAWYLRRKMEKYGNSWRAVAAYHSETPDIGAAYVVKIQGLLTTWGVPDPETPDLSIAKP
ncbi:lytic transglycosylase domain-containing protein [Dyella sp.]|uniref:lytic transglycosylase domain-containing protein n=1 Tax=Dyella sp. TaxID=1869338 RepID=UPI002FDA1DFF